MRERRRGEQARVAARVRALLDERRPGAGPPPVRRPDDADTVVIEAWEEPVVQPAEEPERAGSGPAPPGVSAWLQRRGVRLDPGHRGALAMALAAVVAAIVAGWWVLGGRPHAVAVSSSSATPVSSASSSARATASPAAASAPLVIDVVGRVRHQGVYRLPAGSRVDDALRAAGGPLPGVDLSGLNLARKVADGEQIAVGVAGAAGGGAPVASGTAPAGSSSGPPSGPVDLNTATVAQLDALPGVGPVLAQRIVDWRTAHGRFGSVDQLREVSGIGPSRFDDLRPLVTV